MIKSYRMPLRYFENQYTDLSQGQDIEIDYRLWKTRIREIVENILRQEASFPAQKGGQEMREENTNKN